MSLPCTMRDMVSAKRESLITQMRRGTLEYCVLALLRSQPRYGFDLVRTLGAADGLITSEGTIYPLLSRLRRDGLVTTTWNESPSGPPGATTSSPVPATRPWSPMTLTTHEVFGVGSPAMASDHLTSRFVVRKAFCQMVRTAEQRPGERVTSRCGRLPLGLGAATVVPAAERGWS